MAAGTFVAIFAVLAWVALFLLLGALVKIACSYFFGFDFGPQVEKLYIAAIGLAAIGALIGVLLGVFSVSIPFFR